MPVNDPVPVPESVIARLERNIDQLTPATISHVLRDLDSYAAVEPAALEVSVRRNLAIAVRALRANRPPAATDLGEAEQTTRERFAQGIPVEEIIRAFRISIGLIQERFVETCFAEGVSADVTLSGSRLLWAVGDAFTTRVITAYHAFDLDSALQDAQRRTGYVRAMLHGRLNLAEAAADLATYRIDPDAPYAAIRCLADPHTAERTRRALEAAGSLPSHGALVAVDGAECIGIVARRPGGQEAQVLGMGPFVALRDIADSFRIASRACDVATQLERSGVFGIEDLTWRLAAADHPEVTAFLTERYLRPLRAEGEFGAVLEETLRVYLAHGMNIARSAEVLVTHANTLRYRLRRFHELPGRSLESVEVLVELMWALELGVTEGREPTM
jgi:putative transposase